MSAVYTPLGVVATSCVAIGLCILAIWVAYGQRTNRNILLGTLCFALAVCAVHFLALAGTRLISVPGASEFGPSMSNETLALGVIFFTFVICGACLWVSVTYLVGPMAAEDDIAPTDASVEMDGTPDEDTKAARLQIPCEREGSKVFVCSDDVLFVQADGHYTRVVMQTETLLCVWPMTTAAQQLLPVGFLQTHRSYLVNPIHVAQFERSKDKGRCLFNTADMASAPVSRSKLKTVQVALAAQVGAIRAS